VKAVGRGETEVDQDRTVVGAEKDVGGFDVLVGDTVGVEVLNGGEELAKVGLRSRLRKSDGHETRVEGHSDDCVGGGDDEGGHVDEVGVRGGPDGADGLVFLPKRSNAGRGGGILRSVNQFDCKRREEG
jgi:hypothetical protein